MVREKGKDKGKKAAENSSASSSPSPSSSSSSSSSRHHDDKDSASSDSTTKVRFVSDGAWLGERKSPPVTLRKQVTALLAIRLVSMKRNPAFTCFFIIQPLIFWLAVGILATVLEPRVPKPEFISFDDFPARYRREVIFAPGAAVSDDFARDFADNLIDWDPDEKEREEVGVKVTDDFDALSDFLLSDDKESTNWVAGAVADLNGQVVTDQSLLAAAYPHYAAALNATLNETLAPAFMYLNRVMYNNTVRDSVRTSINALGNAMLRSYSGNSDRTISGAYFRFPGDNPFSIGGFSGGGLMMIGASAMGILIPFFAITVVEEHELRIHNLILVEGMTRFGYWLGHGLSDFLLYLVPALMANVIMACFVMESIIQNNWMGYFMLFMSFGIAAIPMGYLFSLAFKKKETAEKWLPELSNITLFIPWLITTFAFPEESTHGVHVALSVIPSYGLYYGLGSLEAAAKFGSPYTFADCFDIEKGVLGPVLIQLGWAVVATGGIIFIDGKYHISLYRYVRKQCFRTSAESVHPNGPRGGAAGSDDDSNSDGDGEKGEAGSLDSDVDEEATRVSSLREETLKSESDVVVVKNAKVSFVTRYKGSSNIVRAVKGVSFGIKKDEVFGLLGVNGAGKTTLINVLTGYHRLTSGDAWVDSKHVDYEMDSIRKDIGMCPQFDALFEFGTGREHLLFYGRLKGMEEGLLEEAITDIIVALSLEAHIDHPTKTYSGGTKRKISLAICLLGHPRLIFMDEPSTGMDPVSRRQMWALVERARVNRSIVLTTHSMEEADALCSRVVIMVNGLVKCLGTSQHLKSKFGGGYRLAMRGSKGDGSTVLQFLRSHWAGAQLKLSTLTSWDFHVPSEGFSLAKAFEVIEEKREELGILDYQITQTSLEQVFIEFAKQQVDAD